MNTIQPLCCFEPGSSPAGRIGLVSIDEGTVVPMICRVLPDGNVIIATDAGCSLVEDIVGHTVRVEFAPCGDDTCALRTVGRADRAVRVVPVDYHGWYLRADVAFVAVSGDNAGLAMPQPMTAA